MRFDVLTLFPEILEGYLRQSILKLAIQRELVQVKLWNIRDWATGKRKSVDDKPYGGGPGMLIMCPPVFDAVEAVQQDGKPLGQLIMLTPQGRKLDQKLVEELAQQERLLLLCGRYEGFDDRIRQGLQPLEVSVGDFICNGGEVPAMLLIDAVIRLIPGVLGDETSHKYDSFSESGMLEYPQFTRKFITPTLVEIFCTLHLVEKEFYCMDCHYTWPKDEKPLPEMDLLGWPKKKTNPDKPESGKTAAAGQ